MLHTIKFNPTSTTLEYKIFWSAKAFQVDEKFIQPCDVRLVQEESGEQQEKNSKPPHALNSTRINFTFIFAIL